jgi:hypothetical protein
MRFLKFARAGRWLLLALAALEAAWAVLDAATRPAELPVAIAGGITLLAAYLLTGAMIRQLEHERRPRPDYARIRELERDIYGEEFRHGGAL